MTTVTRSNRAQTSAQAARPKKALPYLTEDQLNAQIDAVKIKVNGLYFKRGEHRQDVFEAEYELEIVVPKQFNAGHVKLQVNREIKNPKNKLNGIRVKTFYVDGDFVPEPVKEKDKDKPFRVRDFMSDQTIMENRLESERYQEKLERKRRLREAEDGEEYDPVGTVDIKSRLTDDHNFGL